MHGSACTKRSDHFKYTRFQKICGFLYDLEISIFLDFVISDFYEISLIPVCY